MDHWDAGKDYWVARMLGRHCQDARKDHKDSRMLGKATGMLEEITGMLGRASRTLEGKWGKTTGMPGWTKRLLKGTIRMLGGTTGLLEEITGMPG